MYPSQVRGLLYKYAHVCHRWTVFQAAKLTLSLPRAADTVEILSRYFLTQASLGINFKCIRSIIPLVPSHKEPSSPTPILFQFQYGNDQRVGD